MRWSETVTLEFVKIYLKYECLWNPAHTSYKVKNEREKAYAHICREFKDATMKSLCVAEVKMKIKNLRTTYVQQVHKILRKSGPHSIYEPSLIWFNEMDRCLKHVHHNRNSNGSNNVSGAIYTITTNSNNNDAPKVANKPPDGKQLLKSINAYKTKAVIRALPTFTGITVPAAYWVPTASTAHPPPVPLISADKFPSSCHETPEVDSSSRVLWVEEELQNGSSEEPNPDPLNSQTNDECDSTKEENSIRVKQEENPEPILLNKRKKKKIKHRNSMNDYSNNLNSESAIKEDEFDIYGKYIASQLRKMDLHKALRLQLEIQNLLSEARISELNE